MTPDTPSSAWLVTTGLLFWILADVAHLVHGPDQLRHSVWTMVGTAMIVFGVVKVWVKDSK